MNFPICMENISRMACQLPRRGRRQTTTAATDETARRSVRDDGRMMSSVINKARRWIIRRERGPTEAHRRYEDKSMC
ncbi:hypothetical protein KP509_01G037800 [Ceratopteris richardii]|uniref:Uncharacterized protein n=1 Tax=Ceratopteris richardii TaxID=49495 RepID=A0A8T2VIZ7_CERRI|nr:hypothetical protein KP509_01G037800 [Ceratopteris richardii]